MFLGAWWFALAECMHIWQSYGNHKSYESYTTPYSKVELQSTNAATDASSPWTNKDRGWSRWMFLKKARVFPGISPGFLRGFNHCNPMFLRAWCWWLCLLRPVGRTKKRGCSCPRNVAALPCPKRWGLEQNKAGRVAGCFVWLMFLFFALNVRSWTWNCSLYLRIYNIHMYIYTICMCYTLDVLFQQSVYRTKALQF